MYSFIFKTIAGPNQINLKALAHFVAIKRGPTVLCMSHLRQNRSLSTIQHYVGPTVTCPHTHVRIRQLSDTYPACSDVAGPIGTTVTTFCIIFLGNAVVWISLKVRIIWHHGKNKKYVFKRYKLDVQ